MSEAIKLASSQIDAQTAAERVLELIAEKKPELLTETPFILALCEVYRQRKLNEEVR
jgi:hypothetical protein